jgi:hypothetical protein
MESITVQSNPHNSWFQALAVFCITFWVVLRRMVRLVCTGLLHHKILSLLISHPRAYEDGTDTVFRNVGYETPYAGEQPKRLHITHITLTKITKHGCVILDKWLETDNLKDVKSLYIFLLCSPARPMDSSSTRFLDQTQRRATVGRTHLDEWSDLRRDLYLTTHNTHNRQTYMPLLRFEPTIAVGERT